MRLVVRDGAVVVDPDAVLPGRGAYVCERSACLSAALRRDAARLRRALRAGSGIVVDEAAVEQQWQAAVAARQRDT